ncbi:MAG TPA: hypothetical protein DCR43_01360 [Bacteroidales bacterium]|nr:MAG: hypothetical protein A2X09_16205 [Bacteroidetes bacterium GWF2_43_11]HAQ64499.1 hypothetical protein [Bacteroidales bacterium]
MSYNSGVTHAIKKVEMLFNMNRKRTMHQVFMDRGWLNRAKGRTYFINDHITSIRETLSIKPRQWFIKLYRRSEEIFG